MITMFLTKAIIQLNNLFKSIDNTHKTTTKSIANDTSKQMQEITRHYEQKKRDIVYPMLKGMKGRF